MTNLYELTRALVRRGCPEHPRLRYSEKPWYTGTHWGYHDEDDGEPLMSADESDARAIWTLWADAWYDGYLASFDDPPPGVMLRLRDYRARPLSRKLEAIEAATRHLEPTEHEEDFKHAEPGCD